MARSPNGDAGDAIDWALDHLPIGDEISDFLSAWREGELGEWPDYLAWVKVQHDGAAEARANLDQQEDGNRG